MLKTTLNGNVLTIETPIKKEVADKAFSDLKAKDKDGNEVCFVTVDKCGHGNISSLGLVCNTVVNGNLAVQMVMPMDVTMDDVKKLYGKDLVEVNKHIDAVAEAAEAEIAAINGIFAAQAATTGEA